MRHIFAIFVAAVLAGCVSRAPTGNAAEETTTDQTTIGVVSGPISITTQSKTGEKLWRIEATKADAALKTGDFVTGLQNVQLTLFQKDKPFLKVEADKGKASENERKFMLEGNVTANSFDRQASISAQLVRNTDREGEIEATQQVRARFDGFSVERATSARAFFTDLGAKSPSLRTIALQGDDVWFRSSDGDLTISGVTDGEMEFANENRDVRFKLRGSPVKMFWRRHGLTVFGRDLDASATRAGDRYLLSSGTFIGNIRVELSGTETGASWTAVATAPSAIYDGSNSELRMTGGVHVSSKHPSLTGNLSAPVASVRFDESRLRSQGSFVPIAMSASGGGVRFEEEPNDLLITDLTRITVSRGSAERRMKFDGEGAPLRLRQPRAGSETVTVTARNFEGETGPGTEDGREKIVLLWLDCSNGVTANVSGQLPPEQRTPGSSTWSVEGASDSLSYRRSDSKLILTGVKELKGRHPAIISGEGTIFSPRVEITFKQNTYQPQRISFSKGVSA